MPIAHSWDDIAFAAAANQVTRDHLNKLIGAEWQRQSFKKDDLRQLVLDNPELMADLVKIYRAAKPIEYDFDRDPTGEVVWYRAFRDAVTRFPLALTLPTDPLAQDILSVVLIICGHFKQLLASPAFFKADSSCVNSTGQITY